MPLKKSVIVPGIVDIQFRFFNENLGGQNMSSKSSRKYDQDFN